MTDKSVCKYKYQDREKYKFQGKPYCTCFSKLCEDLPICDNNCQIHEDYKQLKRKEKECEISQHYNNELIKYIDEIAKHLGLDNKTTTIGKNCIEYWAILTSVIKNKLDQLEAENEKLKSQYNCYSCGSCKGYFDLNAENENIKHELEQYKQLAEKHLADWFELQEENEELKQWREDAENILKTQLDNFDKVENRYIQALDEIVDLIKSDCKEYCENKINTGCKRDCTIIEILDIITKAKGVNNDRTFNTKRRNSGR